MLLLFHSWQVLLTISILSLAFATVLQRALLKNNKTDGVTYSIFFQLLAGICISIVALLHGFHMPNLVNYIPNVIFMILLYGFANVFVFKSLQRIEASQFTVLFTSRAIWTVIAATIFLHEVFLGLQIVGMLLILLAVFIVTYTRKFIFNRGTLYALLAGLLFGLAFTNDAYLIRHFDVLSYESISFLLPTLGMFLIYPRTVTKMRELMLPGVFWKLTIFAILWGTASVTIFFAYKIGSNAAQLATIAQTATIITVILSLVLLHERSNLSKKLLGALLAFLGVILIG